MSTRQIIVVAVLVAGYAALGQVVRFIPNPVGPGSESVLALNMAVIVIAGLVLGPVAGALVGLAGTLLNAVSPIGNPFEWASIIPHTIMGISAGLARRAPVVLGALTILVGLTLDIPAYIIAGLVPADRLSAEVFSYGLMFEAVVDVVVISIGVPLLRPFLRPA